jgi:hypothetical protein
MMVQSAPPGEARFISTMVEHNDLCGQFARAFGNERFERIEPYDEMLYVVSHHDRGWDERDANPVLDPEAGVPFGIGGGPVPDGLATSRKSPDFNERRHAYCGLLSSMHSWGLYNARYGFSQFSTRKGGSVSIPIKREFETETRAMLDHELARQQRLKAKLAADPATRGWVDEKHLIQNYKQLQFFDTLALYFNLRHESERGEETYVHVPMTADEDTTVTVRPAGGGTYSFDPFPFAGNRLEVFNHGRYMKPVSNGEAPGDLGAALYALPPATQIYTFIPARAG